MLFSNQSLFFYSSYLFFLKKQVSYVFLEFIKKRRDLDVIGLYT